MAQKIDIINNWTLPRIFQELENGNMRIPRFQRAYVWERSKIVSLLNSIYHQYPIGTFFLWDTDTQMEGFCREITEFGFPKKPEASKFSFILDGQQRITSLYVALRGKTLNDTDYSKICFNLEHKVFKIPKLKTEQNNIPVWKIYDDMEYGNLLQEYYTTGRKDYGAIIQDCHNLLTSYPVSIIKSMNMELDEVVTIFERINQGGKRLSLFDLVHASVWSVDFDLRKKIEEFNSDSSIRIFGKLEPETFIQSLALNLRNDCTKQSQLKLTQEACKDSWQQTTECLRLAIDFVKNLGVQQLSIIPYHNILPIIQYYFFKSGEKSVSAELKKLIYGWFWTVTFSQRYSSSTLTRMNEDVLWIKDLAEGKLSPRLFAVKLSVEELVRVRMNLRSVIKNGILCLMALNNPEDFDNGESVTLDKTNASRSNSKENHHFFPYALRSGFGITQDEANSVINFAFITKRLNQQISAKYPSVYLQKYEAEYSDIAKSLATHFIDENAFAAAKDNDFKSFVALRGATILERINEVCLVGASQPVISSLEMDDGPDDDELLPDDDDVTDEVSATDDKTPTGKRPPLNYYEMGIGHGEILQWKDDPSIFVTVISDRKVEYQGEEVSLSALSAKLKGYNVNHIQPTPHWVYKDRLLSDIYDETYPFEE